MSLYLIMTVLFFSPALIELYVNWLFRKKGYNRNEMRDMRFEWNENAFHFLIVMIGYLSMMAWVTVRLLEGTQGYLDLMLMVILTVELAFVLLTPAWTAEPLDAIRTEKAGEANEEA